MQIVFEIVAPVFGVLLLGFLAAHFRLFEEAAAKGLAAFVFTFAIPVLLFRSMATLELPERIEWGFLVSYLGGVAMAYGLGMAIGRWGFDRPLGAQAVFGMAGGYANTVLLGIPLLLTAYGEDATLPIFLLIAFHSPIFMPLTTVLIQIGRGGEASLRDQGWSVLKELARNPIMIGMACGLLFNLSGLPLPKVAQSVASLLGSAAVPCALFSLGASLAGFRIAGSLPQSLLLTVVKLIVHPLLVWVLAVPVMGLEGIWVPVAVTMAAVPSGVNAYLFGSRYEAAPRVAATTILFTTLGSIVTLSTVLYLFEAR